MCVLEMKFLLVYCQERVLNVYYLIVHMKENDGIKFDTQENGSSNFFFFKCIFFICLL